jgi:hypothetical protein
MLKRIALVVFGLVIGIVISMPSVQAVVFSVNLTQGEVDIAAWKWNKVDPSHVQFATNQLYGEFAVRNQLIGEWKNQRQANRIQIVGAPTGYFCTNTWTGLSQGAKDAVCTGALGDVAGCTPCSADGS